MRDIGAALSGRDGNGKTSGRQPIHAAGRIADRKDGRTPAEGLQLASVQHGLSERRRRVAEPPVPRNGFMRLSAFGHGSSKRSLTARPRRRRRGRAGEGKKNFKNLYQLIAGGQSLAQFQATRVRQGLARG